jgi:hypothetical protein
MVPLRRWRSSPGFINAICALALANAIQGRGRPIHAAERATALLPLIRK